MSQFKSIQQLISPPSVPEGRGVNVIRVIGSSACPTLDPFLLLDHAKVSKPNGFPPHPHRGFETVSYILSGSITHEDFLGCHGLLEAGDVQWMTAGKGIVHVEMPHSNEVEGLQLWVNLKSSDKMCQPYYQDMKNETMSKVNTDQVQVTVIAGQSMGVSSPTITKTPAYYLDISLKDQAEYIQSFVQGWNSLVYVLEGGVRIGSQRVLKGKAAVLTTQELECRFEGLGNSRFILLAGEPIGEAVAQYGPFVMNTQSEIQKTLQDYNKGKNGFEGALGWEPRFLTY